MERDLDSVRREFADIHDLHLTHTSTSAGDAGIGIDEIEARLEEIVAQMRSSR